MAALFGPLATCCSNLFRRDKDDDDDAGSDIDDIKIWHRELHDCSFGQFSFAMVQANAGQIEDEAQVESGPQGLFVGVYDGHGGPRAATFCYNHVFSNFTRIAQERGFISEDTLVGAITATEDRFMDAVRMGAEVDPDFTAVGSCCLVALIWKGKLYVANLGDSRAVIGQINPLTNRIAAEPLTRDDNVNVEEVRLELQAAHPSDSEIVQSIRGIWRVKGHIQVSKAIGDAYLKVPTYSTLPRNPRHRLRKAISSPVLSAEPSVVSRYLQSYDKFLICASDGLWDHISNQRAVEIVNKHPRQNIARRLLRAALKVAARKSGVTYDEVKLATNRQFRRTVHDDITVVVIFFDRQGADYDASVPGLAIRGFTDPHLSARFDLPGVV